MGYKGGSGRRSCTEGCTSQGVDSLCDVPLGDRRNITQVKVRVVAGLLVNGSQDSVIGG